MTPINNTVSIYEHSERRTQLSSQLCKPVAIFNHTCTTITTLSCHNTVINQDGTNTCLHMKAKFSFDPNTIHPLELTQIGYDVYRENASKTVITELRSYSNQ